MPRKKDCLPVMPDILRRIKSHWSKQPPSTDTHMLWAAVTIGFFGFLRGGEFTVPRDSAFDANQHLSPQDIAVDSHSNPTLLRVHLKQSKINPFHQGVYIFIGCSGTDLCAISAVLSYMATRGYDQGPLFRFANGRPLTREGLVSHLHKVLAEIGMRTNLYAGYCFRIGAATTAAAMGVEDSIIKILG